MQFKFFPHSNNYTIIPIFLFLTFILASAKSPIKALEFVFTNQSSIADSTQKSIVYSLNQLFAQDSLLLQLSSHIKCQNQDRIVHIQWVDFKKLGGYYRLNQALATAKPQFETHSQCDQIWINSSQALFKNPQAQALMTESIFHEAAHLIQDQNKHKFLCIDQLEGIATALEAKYFPQGLTVQWRVDNANWKNWPNSIKSYSSFSYFQSYFNDHSWLDFISISKSLDEVNSAQDCEKKLKMILSSSSR